MLDYEAHMFEKFNLVLKAALQNPSHCQDLRIQTTGANPSASVAIPAYILKKFIKK